MATRAARPALLLSALGAIIALSACSAESPSDAGAPQTTPKTSSPATSAPSESPTLPDYTPPTTSGFVADSDGTYELACRFLPANSTANPSADPAVYIWADIINTGNVGIELNVLSHATAKFSFDAVRLRPGQETHQGYVFPLISAQAVKDWSNVDRACNEAGVTIVDEFGEALATAPSLRRATALEFRALEAAYGTRGEVSDLKYLYGYCKKASPESIDYLRTAGSASQIREVQGAMMLCPEWPLTPLVSQYIDSAQTLARLRQQGRVFFDGTHRIGTRIQPGTYYVSHPGNCYWERNDRNGNIIDNFFSTGAARVQVTIASTDYSFSSQDCGEWRPVGY